MTRLLIILTYIFSLNIYSQGISPFLNIDTLNLKQHVNTLGSDLFEGRGTGTRGGELAANYIAKQFKKIGLKPIGENNTFFQNVPLHGSNIENKMNLKLYVNNNTVSLNYKDDYVLANTGEQTIIPYPIDVVFAGFGIIAPEYDHNDYIDKDVTGKIVMIFDGEPFSDDSNYFSGTEPTIYSYLNIKNKIALSKGAAGTILISFSEQNSFEWQKIINDYSFENVSLLYTPSLNFSAIFNLSSVIKIFKLNTDDLYKYFNQYFSKNKVQLKFEGQFHEREFKAQNVIGLLSPEHSISDEYLIVTAHYDHLGIGPEINNDAVYNGVLDNAMGVAALIEIANILQANKSCLEKSIIFLALTGEEHGLLGSIFYTDNPVVPLYKTVANLNIDGIAYIDSFNSVIGIGANFSDLKNVLLLTANKFGLKVENIPKEFYSTEAFNRSDQIAFANAGIPSMLVLDGINYKSVSKEKALNIILNYNNDIYHTPFDDLNMQINFRAVEQHVNFLAYFTYEISVYPEEINWKSGTSYNSIRLQNKAEKR